MATKTKLRVSTHQGLSEKTRNEMVERLNNSLATVADLHSQTKQAHWNVKGKDFYQLHKLFDELAETVEEYVDTIAERITAIGGLATGTVRMAANASELPEYPMDVLDSMSHVELLVERYGLVSKHAYEGIDAADDAEDKATADLYTDLARDIDKALYFLESHIQA